jgi:hypothetical protein
MKLRKEGEKERYKIRKDTNRKKARRRGKKIKK